MMPHETECEACKALKEGHAFWIGEHIFAMRTGFKISLAPKRHVDTVTALTRNEVLEMGLEMNALLGLAEESASQPLAFNQAFVDARRWPTKKSIHIQKSVIFDVPSSPANRTAAESRLLAWKDRERRVPELLATR